MIFIFSDFDVIDSLKMSKTFFQKLVNNFDISDLNFRYEVFNDNGRQGYVLVAEEMNKDFNIWACKSVDGSDLMISVGTNDSKNESNVCDEDTLKYRTRYFDKEDYDSAIKYAYSHLKSVFNEELIKDSHFKFDCNYNMDVIRRIEADASQLDYDDYNDLASFEDINEGYFCDLVIIDGELGLRYSKYCDKNHDEFNNLIFEERKPDLTSSSTLMVGMQHKLKTFIDKKIDCDANIRI